MRMLRLLCVVLFGLLVRMGNASDPLGDIVNMGKDLCSDIMCSGKSNLFMSAHCCADAEKGLDCCRTIKPWVYGVAAAICLMVLGLCISCCYCCCCRQSPTPAPIITVVHSPTNPNPYQRFQQEQSNAI